MKKVTIELTPEQRKHIQKETGDEVQSFTYEALENRDAPKVIGTGGSGDQPLHQDGPGRPV